MYNLSPEALSWKWEAFVYGDTRSISLMTLEKARELRTSIQRSIDDDARKRTAATQPRMMKNVFGGRKPVFASNVAAKGNGTAVAVKMEAMPTSIPRPSKVSFRGPPTDEESKRKRKCACYYHFRNFSR
jgi:hypothetical protein